MKQQFRESRLEKVEGRHATIGDLPLCEARLKRPYKMGFLHGDIKKHNFIIDGKNEDEACLLDLEHAARYDEDVAQFELQQLAVRCAPKFAELEDVYVENEYDYFAIEILLSICFTPSC